jgi:hypothetical protein
MAEIWGAAIVVAGGIASGMAAEKKAKADRKANKEDSKEMTEREAKLNAQQTGYESALERYYTQKDRFDKQRGLDQFRQFSTMGTFAPGMSDSAGRIADPGAAPDYNAFKPAEVVPTPAAGGGGSKGGGGIGDILMKPIDTHKKILKGLF